MRSGKGSLLLKKRVPPVMLCVGIEEPRRGHPETLGSWSASTGPLELTVTLPPGPRGRAMI